jgi:hypothetical protein
MCLSLELCAPLSIKEIADLLSQNTFIGLLGIPKLNCQQKIKLRPNYLPLCCMQCTKLHCELHNTTLFLSQTKKQPFHQIGICIDL